MAELFEPRIGDPRAEKTFAISVEAARRSSECEMGTKICFVDPEVIGIHENTNHAKLGVILESLLRGGYRGPAIAVMESGADTLYETADQLSSFESTDDLKIGIVDGHNRLAILKILRILNLLRSDKIPVQVIPVRHDFIRTSSLDPAQDPLSIDEVQARNLAPQLDLDQSHTFFEVSFKDGSYARVREGQPDIAITRENLIDTSGFSEALINVHVNEIENYFPVEELKRIFRDLGLL